MSHGTPAPVPPADAATWWKRGVFYQVYVPSFQDGNGDGLGDLHGIEQRLDYITGLGVDAVWLSPIYDSPLLDFGYDVAGYTTVGADFGDLETFDRIVDGLHRRGIKVLLDYIPQHTSSEHPWFKDALSGRHSAHRDWYLWADPAADGGPPNNWASAFGGSAWTLHEPSNQYYYHAHLPQQPSLNWRNPQVKRAMFDVMRFWFSRGVDGYRIDAVWRLFKDQQLRDNPQGSDTDSFEIAGAMAHSSVRQLQKYTADQPELPGVLAEMRDVANEFDDRVLMGELHLSVERVAALGAKPGLDIPMNFALIDAPWNGQSLGDLIVRYEQALTPRAWPNWTLGNHDRSRVATRLGPERLPGAMILLLTLRGTPTLYYGDELGLPDQPVPPGRERDCAALAAPGQGLGRDPERTPMPWTNAPNVGFTTPEATPWLPIPDPAPGQTVAEQEKAADSLLQLVRTAIALRHRSAALSVGTISVVTATADTLAYTRHADDERWLVIISFSNRPTETAVPDQETWTVALRSDQEWHPRINDGRLVVPPYAAVVLERHEQPEE
ncbi:MULTISPECIES: alpha-amylase family glycosyl hydrolase [Streptomyces]|uniref:alpha-amylase family glycosyl hydrolase n=1 Tax=Streptomyces lycopersici TaxID=2974589 RepID=UPI0021CFE396|nr:alpha-amylase family glycosyl hydrolase [Streptomyces sp. NEAU-383]